MSATYRVPGLAEAERRLALSPDDLDARVDLILHYSVMLDAGASAALRLSAGEIAQAQQRREALWSQSENPRLRFWRRYWRWAELGEPFEPQDARALAAADPANPEPAVYLFGCLRDPQFAAAARALCAQLDGVESERARYVRAILAAAFASMRSEGADGDAESPAVAG